MYMLSLGLYEYERVTVVVVVCYKCTHALESYMLNVPFANGREVKECEPRKEST